MTADATTKAYVSDVRQHEVLIRGLSDTALALLVEFTVRGTTPGEHSVSAAGDAQVGLLQLLRDNGTRVLPAEHTVGLRQKYLPTSETAASFTCDTTR